MARTITARCHPGRRIAQDNQAKDGDLYRFGFDPGGDDDEAAVAVAHGGKHECSGRDLGGGTGCGICEESRIQRGRRGARDRQHDTQKKQRERKAVQKPDLGRPKGAQSSGQAALNNAASRLRGRSRNGRGDP